MSKKQMSILVVGKEKTWSFNFLGDPKHLEEWKKDGLDVEEVINSIPDWAVELGWVRPWCFFQDIINFKNPFSK